MSFVEDLFPGFAARRARLKAQTMRHRYHAQAFERALEIVHGQTPGARRYEAGTRGRRTEGWRTSPSSANAETAPALALLRDRSRDLVRNNQWAAKAVRVLDDRTVGTGIVPRAVVAQDAGEAARRDAAEARALWLDWAETPACDSEGRTDFYGMQSAIQRSVVEAGEALVRRRWRRASDGLPVPLQLQLLEPDHLDLSKTQQLENGNRIIQGVEYNALGQRTAYWLFPEHPGDGSQLYFSRTITSARRVPAADVLHIYRADRIGQVRGVPWGACCLLKLRDFDDFDDATLQRQKIAACFAGFIHDLEGGMGEESTLPKDAAANPIYDVEPGTLRPLGPGQGVTFSDPPEAGGFEEYARVSLLAIAAGYGVTYESLTGDLSRVNFSSGRMGWLDMDAGVRSWRRKGFVPQLCAGVWSWFMDAALLEGRLDERLRARWTPPRREMLDPLKEIKALREGVRSGFSSLSETIRSLGYEPEELLEELANDLELVDRLKLKLDSDPRQGQASSADGQGEGGPGPAAEGADDRELLELLSERLQLLNGSH
jgi:lambda family phage portal protein